MKYVHGIFMGFLIDNFMAFSWTPDFMVISCEDNGIIVTTVTHEKSSFHGTFSWTLSIILPWYIFMLISWMFHGFKNSSVRVTLYRRVIYGDG